MQIERQSREKKGGGGGPPYPICSDWSLVYTDCGLVSSSPGVLEVGGGSPATLPFWMMHYCLRSPRIAVEVGVVAMDVVMVVFWLFTGATRQTENNQIRRI